MSNLLDSVERFKIARQMARKPVEAQDETDILVKMYETVGPGEDCLKRQFTNRWDKLPQDKRAELVSRLLKVELLPHQVGYAIEIFQGKVISLM